MSPVISKVSFMDSIQAALSRTAVGGMTSATVFPCRVMRMGWSAAYLFQECQALGFEFGDGNFDHRITD